MPFFIEGQVIVRLTDFIGGWLFKPSCCLLQWWQFESTAISRLCSQVESELFVRTYVVGANVAVVLLTAFANKCWSLGPMFGDWLMLWRKLALLFSKAYNIHLHYAVHFTNNVRQSQAFNWVILSQIIQLLQVNETSHDSAEWSCCRKVCAKREVMRKRYLP